MAGAEPRLWKEQLNRHRSRKNRPQQPGRVLDTRAPVRFLSTMDYQAIHRALNGGQPIYKGWRFTAATNDGNFSGRGLFFIPEAWERQRWFELPHVSRKFPTIGRRKLIFELVSLPSGELKLSARGQFMFANEPFDSFLILEDLSSVLRCPLPEERYAYHTKLLATWSDEVARFESHNFEGIADWLRRFLDNPPVSFQQFIDEVPKRLANDISPAPFWGALVFSALYSFGAWGIFLGKIFSREQGGLSLIPAILGLATVSFFSSLPTMRTAIVGRLNFALSLITLLCALFLAVMAASMDS